MTRVRFYLLALGPGLVTAFADNDAGGITTYAATGAKYGYHLIWFLLLLIPVACSLFGISNDLAMQVVGVGFIIGVLQDSAETALNSSTDVLFTAAGSYRAQPSAR